MVKHKGGVQVGAHYIKDLFAMLIDPLKDSVIDSAAQATGTQGILNQAEHMTHQAQHMAHFGKTMQGQFQYQNQYY
jgi:hypothetical protein